MKNCSVCSSPISGRQQKYCSKECKSKANNSYFQTYARQKKRGLKRKIDFVKRAGGECIECGYKNNYAVLHFHHKNPAQKDFTLDQRSMANRSLNQCLTELDKCELLCSNCHMEKTFPDLSIP